MEVDRGFADGCIAVDEFVERLNGWKAVQREAQTWGLLQH